MNEVTGPTKYDAALTNAAGDASLGNGTYQCSYTIVGRVMKIVFALTWGTTTTWGSLPPDVPLPPGYDVGDVDTASMPEFGSNPFVPATVSGNPGGVPGAFFTGGLVSGGFFALYPLNIVAAAMANGQLITGEISFPVK